MSNSTRVSIVTSVIVSLLIVAGAHVLTPTVQTIKEVPIPQENLGAIPGSSIEGKYLTIGGVETAHVFMRMYATSSVPCATKNPFQGNASIVEASANFSDTPTANTRMDLSTSTHVLLSVTSTPALIWNGLVTGGAGTVTDKLLWQPILMASTSLTVSQGDANVFTTDNANFFNGRSPFVIASGEYIGFKTATSSPGIDDVYVGSCNFVFRKL